MCYFPKLAPFLALSPEVSDLETFVHWKPIAYNSALCSPNALYRHNKIKDRKFGFVHSCILEVVANYLWIYVN